MEILVEEILTILDDLLLALDDLQAIEENEDQRILINQAFDLFNQAFDLLDRARANFIKKEKI
jgi:hypothetical protein